MNENVIINLCGEFPKDFVNVDINSDPNFVFKNDPNYNLVKLLILMETQFLLTLFS